MIIAGNILYQIRHLARLSYGRHDEQVKKLAYMVLSLGVTALFIPPLFIILLELDYEENA